MTRVRVSIAFMEDGNIDAVNFNVQVYGEHGEGKPPKETVAKIRALRDHAIELEKELVVQQLSSDFKSYVCDGE